MNNENLGFSFRDGWSFAKCVIADAVGINENMVTRLISMGYTLQYVQLNRQLAAKTILKSLDQPGLNLGWKANAVALAIALGKSAFYCRGEW